MPADAADVFFSKFFKSDVPARDKFLSRLFGIFSEEVVRSWCSCPEAPFRDLGRPTIRLEPYPRWATFDFTLQDRLTGAVYVAELKCELEFEKYRYLTLVDPNQVRHHLASKSFQMFVAMSSNPGETKVNVAGKPISAHGTVLVWGATTQDGVRSSAEAFGFSDVLSVDLMVADLRRWRPASWNEGVRRYRSWTTELFDYLQTDEKKES